MKIKIEEKKQYIKAVADILYNKKYKDINKLPIKELETIKLNLGRRLRTGELDDNTYKQLLKYTDKELREKIYERLYKGDE